MPAPVSPLTLFRLTTRNMHRRPVRTTLTVLGVAVGVVAIVAFTTVARGMWNAVNETIHLDDADLIVFQTGTAADLLSVLDEEETRAKLNAIPDIADSVGTLWHILPIEGQPFCLLTGLRLEDMEARRQHLVRGRSPRADDEIVLGTIAQRVLDKDLDDEVLIGGEAYRVVGIFQLDIVFFDGAIIMSLPRLQRLAGREGRVTLFQVRLTPDSDVDAAVARIEHDYPELTAVGDASEYNKVDQGLEIIRGMVWPISFLALVIGGIVVMNTMWMVVLERTREIGVLRAIGWARRRIVFMIVCEAAGVGLIACLVGCLLGAGLAKLATILPSAELFIEPVFDAPPFLLALAVAVLLSVLGALLPAWRAARISPAEALRYE